MGLERPRPLTGRRGAWAYVPGRTPDIDLAVVALENDLADELEREYQFSTPADTAHATTKTPGIHYLIAGYPAERNSMKYSTSIAPSATHLITGDIRMTPSTLSDKSDAYHPVLGHPGKVVPTHSGARFRVPKPHGMSGGGVWRMEIDLPRRVATSPSLVGIGIEYIKTKQIFVVARVQAASPLVDDLFSLERGLPLAD